MRRFQTTILALVLVGGFVFARQSKIVTRDDLQAHFDAFAVQGSFCLLDHVNNAWTVCNRPQFQHPFIPASTFKICHSLIALEAGVIEDENSVIKWDGVVRGRPVWNDDHDLKTAYKNSTVWYYQELARRIGGQRMKFWLDKAGYGNADTTGGIDSFWLSGGLRITPEQQVLFLKRLYEGKLPFSKRSMDIVKRIMVAKDTMTYTLRAKTGLSSEGDLDIGWYVGYLEKNEKVEFFATCIQAPSPSSGRFATARIEITMKILRALELL